MQNKLVLLGLLICINCSLASHDKISFISSMSTIGSFQNIAIKSPDRIVYVTIGDDYPIKCISYEERVDSNGNLMYVKCDEFQHIKVQFKSCSNKPKSVRGVGIEINRTMPADHVRIMINDKEYYNGKRTFNSFDIDNRLRKIMIKDYNRDYDFIFRGFPRVSEANSSIKLERNYTEVFVVTGQDGIQQRFGYDPSICSMDYELKCDGSLRLVYKSKIIDGLPQDKYIEPMRNANDFVNICCDKIWKDYSSCYIDKQRMAEAINARTVNIDNIKELDVKTQN